MKKYFPCFCSIIMSLYFVLLQNNTSLAAANMQNLQVSVLRGGVSNAVFQGRAKKTKTDVSALFFEDDEPLDINISITVDTADIGIKSELYLVAKYNQQWFYQSATGSWLSTTEDLSNLTAFTNTTLQATENLIVSSNKLLGPGEYLVYGGYLNRDSKIVYNQQAIEFIVFSANQPSLHQFQSNELLISYFKSAFKGGTNTFSTPDGDFSGGTADSTTSSESGNINVSSTNLQEQGVDEADVIKTNGEQLFALDNCQSDSKKTCLSAYQINELPASNQFLSEYQFDTENTLGAFYLSTIEADSQTKEIVTRVSGTYSFAWNWWSYSGNWTNTETEVNIIDVSSINNMQSAHKIKIDGNIVSSRRIANTLYLVTRLSPSIGGYHDYYPSEPNGWVTQEQIDANQSLLDNFSIADIIPDITLDKQNSVALHQAEDCFLPAHTSNKKADKSIISITAIPLDNPQDYQSSCIIGPTESIYVSTQSIYLASSRYQYDFPSVDYTLTDPIDYYKTEIHKFSISENMLSYKGSGDIPGHLGWDANKKPFRMSEYNGQLRVASSIGSNRGGTTSTSLTILQESSSSNLLEKIGSITGLGKTDETLYASRFIGSRGYLVTFKKTDPLYVLDLHDGYNPEVIAELEIEGFSEYLHPIGDTHLLGIGKNAVAAVDEQGNDLGFSWFQGVKLSLFDVTDADSVREVQSMEIGKRPSSSGALTDHHAFTFLTGQNNNPTRFAIPINLYDTTPQYSSWFDATDPRSYYDWTHNGLYVFDLETEFSPGFDLAGKLITAESISDYSYIGPNYGYSILQGNTVHYFYNHKLYSSAISDLEK